MKKYKRIYIEITNICNLSCSFCPISKRKKEYMNLEKFKYILKQIKNYTDYIYLHVKGEPLIHPDIEKILDLCDKEGFKVNLTTNGTIIGQVNLINKPALRQVSFSLQSFESENANEYNKYITNIIEFIKTSKEKSNMYIELRLWNLDDKNDKSKNTIILDTISKELNLGYKLEEKINKGKGIKLADRVYLSQSKEFDWPNISREDISTKGSCYGLRQQIGILVDGTVVPCCLDQEGDVNLGNIFKEDFYDIISKDRSISIVKGFQENKLVEPLCRKCGYRDRFN